jgi:hypothetical protein
MIGSLLVATPGASAFAAASQQARDRLAELDNAALSKVQKAVLGVELLRDEIADPTPDPLLSAADARSHDAVLAHIVRKLRDADEPTLRASWRSAGGELKETLAVLVLLQGEAAAGEEVKSYVLDLKHRLNMRLLAAEGLAGLAASAQDDDAARELGRTFAQVLHEDPQWRPLGGGASAKGEYPVRKLAVAAIRTLQGRGVRMESYVTAAASQSVLEFDGSAAAALND